MENQMPAGGANRGRNRNSRAVAGARHARRPPRTIADTDRSRDHPPSGWGRARRAGQKRRRQAEACEWLVETDLPDAVPVIASELLALEAHLGSAIEAILSGATPESTS